jgi:hypothetical protein
VLSYLTPHGKPIWQLSWLRNGWFVHPSFTVAGHSILVIEPGSNGKKLRVASRKLLTGQLNWATDDGFFLGPPAVCGNTVYAEGGGLIRSFDLQSGVEKTGKEIKELVLTGSMCQNVSC